MEFTEFGSKVAKLRCFCRERRANGISRFWTVCAGAWRTDAMIAKIATVLLFCLFYWFCCFLGTGTDKKNLVGLRSYELPIELIVGIIGSLLFIGMLIYKLNHGRKVIRLGKAKEGSIFGADQVCIKNWVFSFNRDQNKLEADIKPRKSQSRKQPRDP